ncbi:MAG: LysR family transcriptional regulator [Firmicutes bacterium]|nr:LysR family transcriptional regulator [Bacillota bacterium]
MNSQDWLIISTLFKNKNVTKTANALFMTQPALSYRLRKIEQEFGFTIFTRSHRGIAFTEEGEKIAAYADEMLIRLQALKASLIESGTNARGKIRVGVARAFRSQVLTAIILEYNHMYPKVVLTMQAGHSKDLLASLELGDLDVCIACGVPCRTMEKHALLRDPLYIYQNSAIDLETLPQTPYISMVNDPQFDRQIDLWWKKRYGKPQLKLMKVNNLDITINMVRENIGYTIWPTLNHHIIRGLSRLAVTNADGTPVTWDASLFYYKKALQNHALNAFVNLVRGSFDLSQLG